MSDSISKNKAMDIAFKVLSVAVVPVFVWVVSLEVTNAIQDERIQELQSDVSKNSSIDTEVQRNTTALVKLETKLDNVGKNIDEIKRILASAQ